MTRRQFHSLIACSAIPLGRLRADTQDAGAILNQVAEAYQSLRSYQFEGRSISETSIESKISRTELAFVVAYQAPNRFRIEFRYPTAGNWIRVSDGETMFETRTLTRESNKTPVTPRTIQSLNSSPIYAFQRLADTAENPVVIRSEMLDVSGRRVNCDVIQFESRRLLLGAGAAPGQSLVWVTKDSHLVMRRETKTIATNRGETSASRLLVEIDSFRINDDLPGELFASAGKHRR